MNAYNFFTFFKLLITITQLRYNHQISHKCIANHHKNDRKDLDSHVLQRDCARTYF